MEKSSDKEFEAIKKYTDSDEMIISFSEYSNYKTCRYLWYINKFVSKQPPNEYTIFGSAFHKIVESILSGISDKGLLENEYNKRINDSELLSFKKRNLIRHGNMLINNIDRINDYKLIDGKTEEKFERKIGSHLNKNIVLKGFQDYQGYYNKNSGIYKIIDWKTAIRRWNLNKKFNNENITFDEKRRYVKVNSFIWEKYKSVERDLIVIPTPLLFISQLAIYKFIVHREKMINYDNIITSYVVYDKNTSSFDDVVVEFDEEFIKMVVRDLVNVVEEIIENKDYLADVYKNNNNMMVKNSKFGKYNCKYCYFKGTKLCK